MEEGKIFEVNRWFLAFGSLFGSGCLTLPKHRRSSPILAHDLLCIYTMFVCIEEEDSSRKYSRSFLFPFLLLLRWISFRKSSNSEGLLFLKNISKNLYLTSQNRCKLNSKISWTSMPKRVMMDK